MAALRLLDDAKASPRRHALPSSPNPRRDHPCISGGQHYARRGVGVVGAVMAVPSAFMMLTFLFGTFITKNPSLSETIAGAICLLVPTGFEAGALLYGFFDIIPFGTEGPTGDTDQHRLAHRG